MSTVKLAVVMAMTAISTGQVVAGLRCSITDSNGNSAEQTIPTTDFPTPVDGSLTVPVTFEGVLPGSFSGSVQSIDASGTNVGSSVSFSGTATADLQPIPVSVTVS